MLSQFRHDRILTQAAPQRAGVQLRSSIYISRPQRYRIWASGSLDRELAIIHFNDVYNIESRPIEPVGGAARFTYAVKALAPLSPLVLFSGDCFNPSLISAFTRGKQMVPVLNEIGVHAAAVGNHDFDFGIDVLQQHLAECRFPWLLSNVLDRRTGQPLGGALRTHVLSWKGLRIGLVGLVEREWLLTIPSLDEGDYEYLDFVQEGRRLARHMWEEEKVDFLIALSHMRTHNDQLLAAEVPAIQLVLGGHDHHMEITCTQPHGTMLVKSGTDFREFSIIRASVPSLASLRPSVPENGSKANSSNSSNAVSGSSSSVVQSGGGSSSSSSVVQSGGSGSSSSSNGSGGSEEWWEHVPRPVVRCEHMEITSETPEDSAVAAVVREYAELIDTKMDEPLGWAHVNLEARYDQVRCGESNVGNLFSDILRIALQADAAFFNGGTIRSDQVHAAGQLCMRDFVSMLPFTDELVLLELTGAQLVQALETGVGSWPQLEGRFLQVSGISFAFDPAKAPGNRVVPGSVWVAGEPMDPERGYRVATKAYLRGGKDGFDCLKTAPILMDGETAPRLATLVQYLLTRIQELNESIEGEYLPPSASKQQQQQQQQQQPQPGSGVGIAAADNGSSKGQPGQQAQRQPVAVRAAAVTEAGAAAGEASPHPGAATQQLPQQPLHSTASSSTALESEVFLVDGAASSLHTSALVTDSIDESHVAEHLQGREHHHSALDCLYFFDPSVGKYGIAPKLEGRIVRVGPAEAAALQNEE